MSVLPKDFFYKKSRLQQLKGFYHTYRFGTVTKAAEFAGLSPAAITVQIKSIERDLGVKLFNRAGRNIIPTKDADLFYDIIAPRLQAIDGVFEYFIEQKEKLKRKEIKIAAHHTIINYLLPYYVESFIGRHPETKITIQDITKEEAMERLINEETDIGIYASSSKSSELEFYKMASFYPAILMNKNNNLANKKDENITLEDLSKQSMILVDKRQILPYFVKLCEEFNIGSNIEFENGDWETIQRFVKMDMGICLFTEIYEKYEFFKDPDIVSKNIQHLLPPIEVFLMMKKGVIKNKLIEDLIKIIDYSYFEHK